MVALGSAGWLFPTLMLAAVLGITPAFAADPNNGERLAHRWCAPCHVVASSQRVPTGEAPPFATIATKPDFDSAKLAFFLLDPHPKDARHGLIPDGSGRPCGVYCNLQITR